MFGEKNATKILEALQRAKTAPLSRWIMALAINDVGEATAKQLAATHDSLEDLVHSAVLRDIRDLGAKEAERAEISPGLIRLKPVHELAPGEYALGECVGHKLNLDIWDFGVDKLPSR